MFIDNIDELQWALGRENPVALWIKNVTDMWLEMTELGKKEIDYHNIIPPWDKFWVEDTEVDPNTGQKLGHKWGCFIESYEMTPETEKAWASQNMDSYQGLIDDLRKYRRDPKLSDCGRWMCTATMYVGVGNSHKMMGSIIYFVKENGLFTLANDIHNNTKLAHNSILRGLLWPAPTEFMKKVLKKTHSAPTTEDAVTYFCWKLELIFLAISLVHCKNVGIEPMPINRHPKSNKSKRQDIKKKFLFHVLKIKGSRKARKNSEGPGSQKAFHLVRRYMRTYTREKPLFGMHVGTFIIPMHHRGDKDIGIIRKGYSVGGEEKTSK